LEQPNTILWKNRLVMGVYRFVLRYRTRKCVIHWNKLKFKSCIMDSYNIYFWVRPVAWWRGTGRVVLHRHSWWEGQRGAIIPLLGTEISKKNLKYKAFFQIKLFIFENFLRKIQPNTHRATKRRITFGSATLNNF
jgi:hypothetical protein